MATEEVIYTVVGWEQLPLAHYSSYAGTFRAFVEEAARHIDIPTAPRLSHKYASPPSPPGQLPFCLLLHMHYLHYIFN
jgi:hypothetical protein